MLEMNTLALETNALNPHVQASAMHTQLATSDFQAELCQDDYILILEVDAITLRGSKRYQDAQQHLRLH